MSHTVADYRWGPVQVNPFGTKKIKFSEKFHHFQEISEQALSSSFQLFESGYRLSQKVSLLALLNTSRNQPFSVPALDTTFGILGLLSILSIPMTLKDTFHTITSDAPMVQKALKLSEHALTFFHQSLAVIESLSFFVPVLEKISFVTPALVGTGIVIGFLGVWRQIQRMKKLDAFRCKILEPPDPVENAKTLEQRIQGCSTKQLMQAFTIKKNTAEKLKSSRETIPLEALKKRVSLTMSKERLAMAAKITALAASCIFLAAILVTPGGAAALALSAVAIAMTVGAIGMEIGVFSMQKKLEKMPLIPNVASMYAPIASDIASIASIASIANDEEDTPHASKNFVDKLDHSNPKRE